MTEHELLKNHFDITCNKQNDLHPYCELLAHMASDVSSVIEMGIGPKQYGLNSTWGLLYGLYLSNEGGIKKYTAYDYEQNPVNDNIYDAQKIAVALNIDFKFIISNSIDAIIEESDLLFIDTDHRYQHLMMELKLHSPKIKKYIIIHDTSGKYEAWEDWPYNHENRGILKDFPKKYGLWPCVTDFLELNDEWKLLARYEQNCGMTILERNQNEN